MESYCLITTVFSPQEHIRIDIMYSRGPRFYISWFVDLEVLGPGVLGPWVLSPGVPGSEFRGTGS